MTDSIADMLTRIRNAQAVRKTTVRVPFSTLKLRIAEILVREGYVKSVEKGETDGRQDLLVTLKYVNNKPVIRRVQRVSTPGRRVYTGSKRLPYVSDGLGLAIISTSRGLMTNKQARSQNIGGEILCEIF